MNASRRKPSDSDFAVGDLVRVDVSAVMEDHASGQWMGVIAGAEGVVSDITRDARSGKLRYYVALNQRTIDQMPEDYLRDCRERRLQPHILVVGVGELQHHDWSTQTPPVL